MSATEATITPFELSYIALTHDAQRAVELELVMNHATLGHEQSWRRTDSISQGTGYVLVVVCACGAEFYIARLG